MRDASSEGRLIERLHALDVIVHRAVERLETIEERLDEMHQDVKGLLGFRANLLGWAAGISGMISLAITLALAWWRR